MADLMILVAGVAVGIAWTRVIFMRSLGWWHFPWPWYWRESILQVIEAATPSLASVGLALFFCRWRRPRPSIRRLARQPGATALWCSALVFASVWFLKLLAGAIDAASPHLDAGRVFLERSPLYSQVRYSISHLIGPVVGVWWLNLAITGTWRPEPTWIDRAGRCIGAGWIAVYVAYALLGNG